MPRRTINDVFAAAQARLRRVTPEQAAVRVREGCKEDRLILICHEGYSSGLAAVRLQELGFPNTTDV